MSDTWIRPDHLFDGQTLMTGQALRVENGQITDVDTPPSGVKPQSIPGLITPGFIDLQVNGGGGVLLNQTPTVQGMQAIAAAHRTFGTTAILPTVITDAPEVLDRVATAALSAKGRQGIAGLHIEGPHISLARRGTHAAKFIRPLDDTTIAIVTRLRAADIPVMITLACEAATPAQITALAATGAVVSLGHSDASAEDARESLAAGANCFTHLFNAMPPLLNRTPGITGAAINSAAFAGIICDGVHVADEVVGLALRARPEPDTTFLVSDAMPTVGGPDHFDLYGARLHLQDGRLVNAEGSLAGAHVTMAASLVRLVSTLGIPLQQALRMAVTTPARVMDLPDLATLTGRSLDDILVLHPDLTLNAPLSALAQTSARA